MGEYFMKGIAGGSVGATEVIAWADEVVVAAAKTEDWMIEISSSNPDDHTGVLHYLHAVQGEIQPELLAALLARKG